MCVCVCVRLCVCVYVCVRPSVHVCVCVCAMHAYIVLSMCMHACNICVRDDYKFSEMIRQRPSIAILSIISSDIHTLH